MRRDPIAGTQGGREKINRRWTQMKKSRFITERYREEKESAHGAAEAAEKKRNGGGEENLTKSISHRAAERTERIKSAADARRHPPMSGEIQPQGKPKGQRVKKHINIDNQDDQDVMRGGGCGGGDFVKELEQRPGRSLTPKKRGPKPKAGGSDEDQPELF